MPQFFVDQNFAADDEVEIDGSDAHHISRVLRLTKGDWLVLSDGTGRSFRAIITKSDPKNVRAIIKTEVTKHQKCPAPVLALAIIGRDRFEWAIQKSVELGCRHIIPIVTRRTVSHRATSTDHKKLDRWQHIALEAAKQSGLPFIPEIAVPTDFDGICALSRDSGSTVLFHAGEENFDIRKFWKTNSPGKENLLVVGPEGGFADDEITKAKNAGMTILSLGHQILRVETAAISIMTIWQYELGNMDIK